jgi:hypothetical protein
MFEVTLHDPQIKELNTLDTVVFLQKMAKEKIWQQVIIFFPRCIFWSSLKASKIGSVLNRKAYT